MAFRPIRTGGAKAPRPLMAAQSPVRQEMALQDLKRENLRGDLFDFAKSSRLRDVFPPSSAAGQLVPRVLDPTVQLFHPAIGGGGVLDRVLSFTITGVAGSTTVEGSEIPAGSVFYIPFMVAFHDDPVARNMRLYVRHVATNRFVSLQDTRVETAYVPIPQNTGFPTKAPFYVPPGWLLGAEVFLIGAPNTASLQGGGALLSIADHPPAGF